MLRVGWLIDGRGGTAAIDQVMAIDQGCICSIEAYRASISRDAELLDLTGATVLPALMPFLEILPDRSPMRQLNRYLPS